MQTIFHKLEASGYRQEDYSGPDSLSIYTHLILVLSIFVLDLV